MSSSFCGTTLDSCLSYIFCSPFSSQVSPRMSWAEMTGWAGLDPPSLLWTRLWNPGTALAWTPLHLAPLLHCPRETQAQTLCSDQVKLSWNAKYINAFDMFSFGFFCSFDSTAGLFLYHENIKYLYGRMGAVLLLVWKQSCCLALSSWSLRPW